MEGSESAHLLSLMLTQEERDAVPTDSYKKIESFVVKKFDELFTSKALLETGKFNAEKDLKELEKKFECAENERKDFSAKLEAASNTITELENQLSTSVLEITKLQNSCSKLEVETAEFRHQRNLAVDEKEELMKMIERRNSEIERMQAELENITKQLETAIATKCEALAQVDEISSMKLTLEYKEKRIEQERSLFDEQMQSLTEDLRVRTEELLNMRRDNTSRSIQLETKLAEKTQELTVATDSIKMLTDLNNNLSTKAQELSQKLLNEKETFANTQEALEKEMEAQSKLADLYKEMSEEKIQHAETLAKALSEVKAKLDEAVEKYGDLETKHKESQLAHEEIIAKKNECIAMLKKELEAANVLLDNTKQNQLEKEIEGLSPTAAAASKLVKTGMTLTQIYSQHVTTLDDLANEKEENARLKAYINQIFQELQDKSPLLTKQREEYEKALENICELTKQNDELIIENQQLREENSECKRSEGVMARENGRFKKELADLARQVCHLLREVEHSRIGSSSTSTDQDIGDSVSSADIISKRLVTFSDIAELQSNNQRLLALVRELTSKQEEAESLDPAAVAKLTEKLHAMREEHAELLEQQEKQSKMINVVIGQRDLYKSMYHQLAKGGDEVPMQLDMEESNIKPHDESEIQVNEKIQQLEAQLEKAQKDIERMKEENDTYRNEKLANEKILIEQMEKIRTENQELTRLNTRLSAKCESNDDLFKILKNNTEIYKNQIEKLEERNKIYNDSIVKHETSLSYLKDQCMDAQSKLSRAEVMLGNLQKENALIKDSETRLMREREMMKKEMHSTKLLHTNIELIKATLERSDAEHRMRLEEQLKEAHRECSALRRRLQEEQDRFRQLGSHLEKQVQNAQSRMEEEKQQADKLRLELQNVREDLIAKVKQLEDLSKKLKSNMLVGADNSSDTQRFRELEKQVSNTQAEVENLQQKLKIAKEAAEQHSKVAEGAEKQLVDIMEQHKQYISQKETKIKEQEAVIAKLQEQCSELQGELSIQNDGQETTNYDLKLKLQNLQSNNTKLETELQESRKDLEAARNEIKMLSENLESAESKYAREMMLHSTDLQQLTSVKEELMKTINEMNDVKIARDCAIQSLEESKSGWEIQETLFKKEKEEMENRLKDMNSQNALLLDQLQSLNTQLAVIQAQTSEAADVSLGDISLSKSLTEDDVKSSEQLLKIIKYLRQEKDIAVSKCEILQAEHMRLKTAHDVLSSQLTEAKSALESERQKSEVSVVTSAKHAEVLRRVETLNAITDSNRCLRIERDSLITQIEQLKTRVASLEEQLSPLQDKNHELSIKSEAMQTENITLREEAKRWRQRANILIEKSNRTSPEDWKKLQNERESLAKQLTIERSNTTKLTDELNSTKESKSKLEEQLKQVRQQQTAQKEELDHLTEELGALRGQLSNMKQDLDQATESQNKISEENRTLKEDVNNKNSVLNDLKNNLVQIRKIAKKYKTQCEDQLKEFETLKQQNENKETVEVLTEELKEQLRQEGRTELEQRITQLELAHSERINELNQQVSAAIEENDNYKKEIESLKQSSFDKEERFKALFKNAKDRIMSLTTQNNTLKAELTNQGAGKSDSEGETRENQPESQAETEKCEKEKQEILFEKQQEKERLTAEIEALTQKVNQLQRQLGLQQGSKPSTSSGPTEKSISEPPTANIKPMAGHSTNTQTQSVQIQPWRSSGEPPLASIRPMSVQVRTVAVPPTSQSPSAVVPPQQQVHTTGTGNNAEAISSSPSSSHTDYAPATSSASSATHGPKQVSVPPTQSTQDTEDEDVNMQVQPAPQQQAVALVLPRVEPPSSGSSQEQGTSSGGSSNTVTTTQAGLKRPREADTDSSTQSEEAGKSQQPQKRSRVQQGTTETFQSVSESGLEVEYQVPTSSQRDHEEDTDAVIVVESDDEGEPDEGEGADDDPDDDDTEGYEMDVPYQVQEGIDDEDEAGNEVDVIEDSSEVPNQSERSEQDISHQEENNEQAQSEAISSGTDGNSDVTVSQASTSTSATMTSFSRTRPVAPLSRSQQSHLLLPHGVDESGDDGIVPSTPTLFVPRRSDGFGEAVSSPHVPTCGRFTFNETVPPSNIGSTEIIPEQTLEVANIDDNSTGRSVPSTPLQTSPQEAGPSSEEHTSPTEVENPLIIVNDTAEEPEQAPEGSSRECMGPPSIAGTSGEPQAVDQPEEMLEGEDGVSSEGEKPPTTEESEEEGREAEASPSTNTRSKNQANRGQPAARRSVRQSSARSPSRSMPTPIVWGPDHQRSLRQDSSHRGRGVMAQGNYSPRNARRSRSRNQRPYTRF